MAIVGLNDVLCIINVICQLKCSRTFFENNNDKCLISFHKTILSTYLLGACYDVR